MTDSLLLLMQEEKGGREGRERGEGEREGEVGLSEEDTILSVVQQLSQDHHTTSIL